MPCAGTTDRLALNVAILGAGQVARHHVEAFVQLGPDVRIIGIADVDEGRAVELAATCGARAFTEYQALLDLAPDIAVICLPHHLHREAGLAAAAAGSHVLMEKPMGRTLEDGHAIVDGCRQHGVLLTVSFVHRYRIEFQWVHELVARGCIGTPAIALDTFCTRGGAHVPGWVWDKRRAGGGVLMYTGIHSIDRLRWLLASEVREVFARTLTYSQDVAVEDGLTATLMFANGCLATLVENSPDYMVTPRSWRTEIYGSRGWVRARHGESLEFSSSLQAYRLDVTRDAWWVAQAREFVTAVRERREPWITGEDGLRALEIAMAIYRSAELSRPVSMSEIVQ